MRGPDRLPVRCGAETAGRGDHAGGRGFAGHRRGGDVMKRIALLAVMAAAPLLMAALWMDKQPSYKPYQAPVLVPPAGSVPITGRELDAQDSGLKNPITSSKASLEQGQLFFAINCAMCHGQNSTERGPVGKKLNPPPPGLDHELIAKRSDAHIFKAITMGFGRMPPFKDKLTPRE